MSSLNICIVCVDQCNFWYIRLDTEKKLPNFYFFSSVYIKLTLIKTENQIYTLKLISACFYSVNARNNSLRAHINWFCKRSYPIRAHLFIHLAAH